MSADPNCIPCQSARLSGGGCTHCLRHEDFALLLEAWLDYRRKEQLLRMGRLMVVDWLIATAIVLVVPALMWSILHVTSLRVHVVAVAACFAMRAMLARHMVLRVETRQGPDGRPSFRQLTDAGVGDRTVMDLVDNVRQVDDGAYTERASARLRATRAPHG